MFTGGDEATLLLLKVRSSNFWLPAFLEKYSSLACLFRSGLNCILHWKAQFFINSKSLFKVAQETCLSKTLKKREVSSANILQLDSMLSGKSFMYTKKNRGPSTDP